jgi:hypothetical protein
MGQTRIMFIENKDGESNLTGDARIGRVTFSKTGKSIHYNGQTFERMRGFKANYRDIETYYRHFRDRQLADIFSSTINGSENQKNFSNCILHCILWNPAFCNIKFTLD